MLVKGFYSSSPTAFASGKVVPLLVDQYGRPDIVWNPTAVNTYTADVFTNVGANTTLNVKATAGNVFAISCINTNAAARYFQLHNTATTPAGGAAPVCSWLIPATGMVVLGTDFFTQNGMYFSTGIAFAYSTAFLTYVAGTAGEQVTCVRYK